MILTVVGAVCAAVGSLVTGYLLKAAESRRLLRHAGRLEVERKQALDAYDALAELTGSMAELEHCVFHISSPRTQDELDEYLRSATERRKNLRAMTRANTSSLGAELVQLVTAATDELEGFLGAARSDADACFEESRTPNREILLARRHEWRARADDVRVAAAQRRREIVSR